MTTLPICCVTGRIAGDPLACGDCDPCGAAHTVPEVVKQLIKERDEWADKYADAMAELDEIESMYGCDTAKSIVVYFLCNATSWRGETARRIKAELKGML